MGKYRDFPSHTPLKKIKICNLLPQARRQASPSLLYGVLLGEKREHHHNPLPVRKFTVKKLHKALNLQCMYLTKEVIRLLPLLGTNYAIIASFKSLHTLSRTT